MYLLRQWQSITHLTMKTLTPTSQKDWVLTFTKLQLRRFQLTHQIILSVDFRGPVGRFLLPIIAFFSGTLIQISLINNLTSICIVNHHHLLYLLHLLHHTTTLNMMRWTVIQLVPHFQTLMKMIFFQKLLIWNQPHLLLLHFLPCPPWTHFFPAPPMSLLSIPLVTAWSLFLSMHYSQ